jgi:hypothetical protein
VPAKQASTSWAPQRENSGSWEICSSVSNDGCGATEHQGGAVEHILLYASAAGSQAAIPRSSPLLYELGHAALLHGYESDCRMLRARRG